MNLIDTHVHLGDAQFDSDRDEVLRRAAAAGVDRLIEIADTPADWDKALALARARPQVRASLGLHPYYAAEYTLELKERLSRQVRLPEVVAIGEIGLDYVKSEVPPAVQRKAFEELLAAAKRWSVPAVIHCRGAYPDLLAVIGNLFHSPPPNRRYWGVVHCFSGDSAQALSCVNSGFALGCDGPITYPKNDALREAFRAAGVRSAVLETDSPYLPPQSSRGKRNEPAAVVEIARRLADVFSMPPEELARVTTENALELYRLAEERTSATPPK